MRNDRALLLLHISYREADISDDEIHFNIADWKFK